MSQQLHTMRNNQIHNIIEWLQDLLEQRKDGKVVHHIQTLQIVNCYVPHVSIGYMAVVVCLHSDHEFAETIAEEIAEAGSIDALIAQLQ